MKPHPVAPEAMPKEPVWIGEAANTPEKAEKLVELFHGVCASPSDGGTQFDEAKMWALKEAGCTGLDMSPGDENARWAYEYILELERQRDEALRLLAEWQKRYVTQTELTSADLAAAETKLGEVQNRKIDACIAWSEAQDQIKELRAELAAAEENYAALRATFDANPSAVWARLEKAESQLATQSAEVEAMKRDKERLDWLLHIMSKHGIHALADYLDDSGPLPNRDSIDAARATHT